MKNYKYSVFDLEIIMMDYSLRIEKEKRKIFPDYEYISRLEMMHDFAGWEIDSRNMEEKESVP